MSQIYLGLRLPRKPYERILINNVDLNNEVKHLKSEAANATHYAQEDLVFIYSGNILKDCDILHQQGIKSGVTINVVKKHQEYVEPLEPISKLGLVKISALFDSLTFNSCYKASTRPEILKKIIDEFPALRRDLGAISIIRDPALLYSFKDYKYLVEISERHPILIHAAKYIFTCIKQYISKKILEARNNREEQYSDSSSGSEPNTPSTSREPSSTRRITRNQLASAITSTLNALPLARVPLTGTEQDTNAGATSSRITSLMLNNAILQALGGVSSAAAATAPTQPSIPSTSGASSTNESTIPQSPVVTSSNPQPMNLRFDLPPNSATAHTAIYATELQQMRDMSLFDETINLEALIICDGNVEAAINLVLSGMNN